MKQNVVNTLGKFKYLGEEWTIAEVGAYTDGTPCIRIFNSAGTGWTLTTHVSPMPALGEGEYVVKTWSENQDVTRRLLIEGIFTDTGRKAGDYTQAPIWKLTRFGTV